MAKKQIRGKVVSDKMDKTVVVRIDRELYHSKYGVRYKTNRKFKVHDEENKAKVGDEVIIEEAKPISKDKKWKLTRVVNSQNT